MVAFPSPSILSICNGKDPLCWFDLCLCVYVFIYIYIKFELKLSAPIQVGSRRTCLFFFEVNDLFTKNYYGYQFLYGEMNNKLMYNLFIRDD